MRAAGARVTVRADFTGATLKDEEAEVSNATRFALRVSWASNPNTKWMSPS